VPSRSRPGDGDQPVAAGEPGERYADGGYGDSGSYGSGSYGGAPDQGAGTPGEAAAARILYGAAGGTAGKGPVRGFPPAPGQSAPVYPAGQFSAWNTSPGGTRPVRPDGSTGRDAWPVAASAEHGYAEPDYSVLAVSDPAADVTATQTWAVVDDRTAGGWRDLSTRDDAPPERAGLPGASLPGSSRPGTDRPGAGRRARGHQPRQAAAPQPAAPQAAVAQAAAPQSAAPAGPDEADGRGGRPARANAAGPADHAQPPLRRAAGQAGDLPGRPRGSARGKRGRKPAKRGRVLLAAGLALIVVAGSGTYFYLASHQQPQRQAAAPAPSQTAGPTAQPSPTPTGRWGHIQTRRADPQPLTLAELFPVRFTSAGSAYSRTAARAGKHCSAAVLGSRLPSAVRAAGCTQVMRASYLSGNRKLMGTIGVLNLKTARLAGRAGRTAGPSEFIAQLRGAKGPTRNLTKGTGIEEAEVKGHYLILIWAEFANLHAPKGAAKKQELEQFCTRLLASTANVSLSRRLVTGQP
jgi:hypothetical protein